MGREGVRGLDSGASCSLTCRLVAAAVSWLPDVSSHQGPDVRLGVVLGSGHCTETQALSLLPHSGNGSVVTDGEDVSSHCWTRPCLRFPQVLSSDWRRMRCFPEFCGT